MNLTSKVTNTLRRNARGLGVRAKGTTSGPEHTMSDGTRRRSQPRRWEEGRPAKATG